MPQSKVNPGLALLLFALMGTGCSSTPRDSLSSSPLTVLQQAGGTHFRTLVHEGWWYQTQRDRLLVLNPATFEIEHEVAFAPPGDLGSAIDMVILDHQLFVVLEDDGVAQLDLTQPARPRLIDFTDARTLGILPRRLSVVESSLYVSGKGGVVRFADGQRIFADLGDVMQVVKTGGAEGGLVTCIGRRVHRVSDRAFVGSASTLQTLPETYGLPGHLVFVRHVEGGSQVGLMTPEIREVSTKTSTVMVEGRVSSIRFLSGLIWVVSDRSLSAYRIEGMKLTLVHRFEGEGFRDVGLLDDNRLAVAGTFGRGILRIFDDAEGPGGTMIRKHVEPGQLTEAQSDGRRILAGTGTGFWLYDMTDNQARVTDRRPNASITPNRVAVTIDARVVIDESSRTITMTSSGGERTYLEPDRAVIHCVVSVGGYFWLGHDRGITVLDPDRADDPVIGRLRLPGPVSWIFPQLSGNGAAYVSEFGGFGVVEFNASFE